MSTTYTLGASVRVRVHPYLGIEAMGFAPLSRGSITAPQSTATSSTWVLGAGAFWHVPVAPRTGIELGAGGLWARLDFTGTPGPLLSRADGSAADANAISGYLRAGADLALTHSLALRLDLLGGVAFIRGVYTDQPPPSPNTPDNRPRFPVWPRMFAAALGGVEARWF